MQQHEEDVKRRLYKTLLATVVVMGVFIISIKFFAPSIGSFFGLISKIGKPKQKEDTLSPPPPYFYNIPTVTNKKEITIKGFSEPQSKVKIFVNGPEIASTVADETGTFTFDNVILIEGRNTIFAKAEDSFQNESENSQIAEISYDIKKPKITITEPKNESIVKNLNQRILVKGSLDEKCEIKINDKLAIVRPDNSFELLLGVAEGWVEIKIEATDVAGNQSDEKIKVKYVKSGI